MACSLRGEQLITENYDKFNFLSRFRTFATFLLFICLAAYAMGANPFSGQTVAPFDRLLQFSGWSTTPTNGEAVHAERSDILDSQLPTWMTLKEQIRSGRGALWYPNGAGGSPTSTELSNPPFLLFLSIKDNAFAYYVVGLAKLAVSGFGCYLLLRIFLGWLPSLWGGIVFMLCGFNAAWFFWDHVGTAMWIPWLLWAAVFYLKTDDAKWLPAITLASLLLIFGNFPAVAAFGFYAFSLLMLVWNSFSFFSGNRQAAFRDRQKLIFFAKKTALPFLAVGIAFLMSAITLIPFMDSFSGVNLSYRAGGGTPFSFQDLTLLFSYESPPRVERTAFVGIPVCLLALAGIFPAFKTQDRNLKIFILFNALLVTVALLITFGLLPHGLIRSLPVFKSNNWGRLIVIALLGLAVLSAIGLDYLTAFFTGILSRQGKMAPIAAGRVLVFLTIALIVFQFYSQKRLFNNFNAVVPSSWFYPPTPSIHHVKGGLKPLQSVIADDSYWFAGTLGAYGIPEWYAHSFRTDREKEVLGELVRDPYSSPTSMLVDGRNIQFSSPWMDKLAIKYVLVSRDVVEPVRLYSIPEITRITAPPLPLNSWKQHIVIPNDMLIGSFAFLFEANGKRGAPADVRLTVRSDGDSAIIAESVIDNDLMAAGKESVFKFPKKVYFRKGSYSLVLSLVDYAGPDTLTARATMSSKASGNYLEINGAKTDISLRFGLAASERIADLTPFEKKWNVLDLEPDILVFENKHVAGGAYFLKSLDASNEQMDFSKVDVKWPAADQIFIDYAGPGPGWIVLPMHLHAGWKAYIDDRQADYDAYLGMLPAIPVSGAGRVVFKFQSASWRWGIVAGSSGGLIFLAFLFLCLRKAGIKHVVGQNR